jgi:steroid delta-isomerase-like uncharacterized protein
MLEGGKGYGDLPSAGSGRRKIRMSAQENKALARRWVEGLFNEGNMDVADEILSPDFVLHVPFDPRELRGPEAVKQFVSAYRQAYPDGHTTIEDQIAEGDMAVNRWTARGTHQGEFQGIAPTGNRIEVTGIDIVRIAEGKLAEGWVELDGLGWLQQLGAIPAPGQSEEASPT